MKFRTRPFAALAVIGFGLGVGHEAAAQDAPPKPHINLIEDTTGKGHITRNFGPEDRVVLTVPLGEGVLVEGKPTPRTK